MTYNGIGLRTPRGSGTNGYIQRNLAHISRPRQEFIVGLKTQRNRRKMPKPNKLRVDKSIMDHNRKRQIEVLVCKQQCKYEDQGKSEEEIEKLTNAYRQKLLSKFENGIGIINKPNKEYVAILAPNQYNKKIINVTKNEFDNTQNGKQSSENGKKTGTE